MVLVQRKRHKFWPPLLPRTHRWPRRGWPSSPVSRANTLLRTEQSRGFYNKTRGFARHLVRGKRSINTNDRLPSANVLVALGRHRVGLPRRGRSASNSHTKRARQGCSVRATLRSAHSTSDLILVLAWPRHLHGWCSQLAPGG